MYPTIPHIGSRPPGSGVRSQVSCGRCAARARGRCFLPVAGACAPGVVVKPVRCRFVPQSPAGFVGNVTTPVRAGEPSAESFDELSPRQLAQPYRRGQSRRFLVRVIGVRRLLSDGSEPRQVYQAGQDTSDDDAVTRSPHNYVHRHVERADLTAQRRATGDRLVGPLCDLHAADDTRLRRRAARGSARARADRPCAPRTPPRRASRRGTRRASARCPAGSPGVWHSSTSASRQLSGREKMRYSLK